MSFSLTEKEQSRVDLAAVFGLKLDPIGHADLALIITISSVYGIGLLAILFMLWNRKYPPIKSKSPYIMAAAYCSCILWFAGDLATNGHIHLDNNVLRNCKAFGVWVRVLLGVCTVSSLIALRSYGLYRVFRLNLPYRGVGFYVPFLIYCGCIAVYGIVSQALSPKITIEFVDALEVCLYHAGFKASLFALLWVTWIIVAIINWNIRKIKSSFNESREMLFACAVVFTILLFTTIMHYVEPKYPLNQNLRCISTGLDHLATNVVLWSIMGGPVFHCLVHRKKYLKYWTVKLRRDGLQHQYDVASMSSGTTHDTLINAFLRKSRGANDRISVMHDGVFGKRFDNGSGALERGYYQPDSSSPIDHRESDLGYADSPFEPPAKSYLRFDPFDISGGRSPTIVVTSSVDGDPFVRDHRSPRGGAHGELSRNGEPGTQNAVLDWHNDDLDLNATSDQRRIL